MMDVYVVQILNANGSVHNDWGYFDSPENAQAAVDRNNNNPRVGNGRILPGWYAINKKAPPTHPDWCWRLVGGYDQGGAVEYVTKAQAAHDIAMENRCRAEGCY